MNIIKARQELNMGKTIYDMKLRIAPLVRVSTEKEEQINSSENQIKHFIDMVDENDNWTLYKIYADEGISGTQAYNREQFMKMIEDARLGKFDLIITKEVSRFARNTVDSINYTQLLLSYGVAVYFVSDNINTLYPDSEFRLTLMASMAQDEVRKLSERVKFGIKRSIKDGKVGGGPIYGYDKKNCKLTINETEAKAVNLIFNLYSTGEYGFKKISEILEQKGYRTKKGKRFSDITLRKMILNPRYKGYYTANLSYIENYKTHKKVKRPKEEWIVYKDESGRVPAIISEELWNKANEVHEKRISIYNKNVVNKQFYLENRKYTSKIYCSEHNSTFIRCANGKRKYNPVWQCNEYLRHGIKGCKTTIINEKILDYIFINVLEKIIDNKEEIFNKIIKDYTLVIKESNSKVDLDLLRKKLEEKKLFKERLFNMSLRQLIDDKEFVEKKEKINLEINEITNELVNLESQLHSSNYINEMLSNIKEALILKLDIKNDVGKFFDLFIDKVFVKKIDDDRKNIDLKIIYNFKKNNDYINIKLHDIKNPKITYKFNKKIIDFKDFFIEKSIS